MTTPRAFAEVESKFDGYIGHLSAVATGIFHNPKSGLEEYDPIQPLETRRSDGAETRVRGMSRLSRQEAFVTALSVSGRKSQGLR